MEPVATIRRLGFRKWYERQLIDCHAALVTCFLCGLTAAALLEDLSFAEFGGRGMGKLAIVFVAVVLGWFAWRRYITVLERAERYGQTSTCGSCKTYGRFEVTHSGVDFTPGPTAEAVARMQPGSVIIDLAAERGGNCALTKADERVVVHGVTILAPTNLPSDMPYHASQMFSANVTAFLLNLVKNGQVVLNCDDPIIRETLVAYEGQVVQPRLRELLGLPVLEQQTLET